MKICENLRPIKKPAPLLLSRYYLIFASGDKVRVALRTENESSPEKTKYIVFPSSLIHLVGKLPVSPGPVSHFRVKNTVVHGPQGSGAS